MVCVRIVGQGVPVRMDNEAAAKLVNAGDAEYCPKQFWKAWWDQQGVERKYV